MRHKLWLALVINSLLLGGCNTVPVDETGTFQQSAKLDRRSPEVIAIDNDIEQAVREELAEDNELLGQSHLVVNAYNGLALVTGEVASEELKNKIIEIIRVIPNVRMVRDSLEIAAPIDATTRANDKQLSARVKTALTQIHTLPDFNSAMVKVITENGVVYLMGKVSKEEGNVVINVTRLEPNIKQIITVFEYLD